MHRAVTVDDHGSRGSRRTPYRTSSQPRRVGEEVEARDLRAEGDDDQPHPDGLQRLHGATLAARPRR